MEETKKAEFLCPLQMEFYICPLLSTNVLLIEATDLERSFRMKQRCTVLIIKVKCVESSVDLF